MIVGFAAVFGVALFRVGLRQAELRKRLKRFPVRPTRVVNDGLEVGDSLGLISRGHIGASSIVEDHDIITRRDGRE